MTKINVHCPVCSKKGKIDIDETIINKNSRGVTAINIDSEEICDHTFIVYVDRNLAVRDCFSSDFLLELPQMAPTQEITTREIPGRDIFDVDLIKINLPGVTLASLLKGIFFGNPILLLYDEEFLHRHVENLFKFITQDNFDYELLIGDHQRYKKNKKHFKNYLVFDKSKSMRDKDRILDPKKLKIEMKIVEKFYAEYDDKSSILIIKNELQKAYILANAIKSFLGTIDTSVKVNYKPIQDAIEKEHNMKIGKEYFDFTLDIVRNYFNIKVPIIYDSFIGFL